jgi:hypothetical protein
VHEDVLDEVLGVLPSQARDEHAMNRAAEAAVEFAKGLAISARGGRHHGRKVLERQVVRKTLVERRPLTDGYSTR